MRFTSRVVTVTLALAALTLSACVEPTAPPSVGHAGPCVGDEGVTVVVEFAEFGGDLEVGCALGDQLNGYEALTNAGFVHSDGGEPGVLCKIDGLPATTPGGCFGPGYWSYWKNTPAGAWAFSEVGASDGPLIAGSYEGWSWAPAPAYDGQAPAQSPLDLGFIS